MDHDHNHGDTDPTSCPMIMVFHGGHCERILWSGWVASSVTQFVFSCLAFFALGFIFELLKFIREYLQKKDKERTLQEMRILAGSTSSGDNSCHAPLAEIRQKTYKEHILNSSHIISALINIIQIALGYLLMLVFMNYNYWLCLAVVLGIGLGYYLFGWIKQDMYEHDCCN